MIEAELALKVLHLQILEGRADGHCATEARPTTVVPSELRAKLDAAIQEVVLASMSTPAGVRRKAEWLEQWLDVLEPSLGSALAKSLAKDVLALPPRFHAHPKAAADEVQRFDESLAVVKRAISAIAREGEVMIDRARRSD